MTIKGNSDPMWETNALLAIDTKAKATKLIRKVGYSASRRPGRDGGVCAVWGAAA